MVALTGNELGFIGAIIGGVSTIAAAVMSNAAAARRQRREQRYQRGGSGTAGFLLALLFVSIGAGLYFATRPNKAEVIASEPPTVPTTTATVTRVTQPAIAPTAAPTIAPTSAPAPAPAPASMTVEEAAALVTAYLQTGNNAATTDQAWTMFSDANAAKFTNGIEGFRTFWRSVKTVDVTGAAKLVGTPTPTRAVVELPLKYQMVPELIKPGSPVCRAERDDFTVVRISGVLLIDDAQISPGTFEDCTPK